MKTTSVRGTTFDTSGYALAKKIRAYVSEVGENQQLLRASAVARCFRLVVGTMLRLYFFVKLGAIFFTNLNERGSFGIPINTPFHIRINNGNLGNPFRVDFTAVGFDGILCNDKIDVAFFESIVFIFWRRIFCLQGVHSGKSVSRVFSLSTDQEGHTDKEKSESKNHILCLLPTDG